MSDRSRSTVRAGVPLASAKDFRLEARTNFTHRDLLAARADSREHVLPIDLESPAVSRTRGPTVNLRFAGVVMIDRNPLKLRFEITFHLTHEPTNMPAQVHAIRVFRRHDQAPHQFVALFPGLTIATNVDVLPLGVEPESFSDFRLGSRAPGTAHWRPTPLSSDCSRRMPLVTT